MENSFHIALLKFSGFYWPRLVATPGEDQLEPWNRRRDKLGVKNLIAIFYPLRFCAGI